MRKTTLMLLFVSILFVGFTACKKSDNKKTDDTGNGDGDGGNTSAEAAASLKGSNYYLIAVDGETEAKIHSKVTKDLRVDESTIKLFVWNETYVAGTATGPNAFGVTESWISLVVGSVGWSGFGISPEAATVDLSGVTNDYVLHLAMKSKDNATHVVALADGSGEYRVAIGASGFNDNGKITPAYTNFKRDGEWHHMEIPISEFTKQGLTYRTGGFTGGNIFYMLSGGTPGITCDVDGVFIYKPAK